MKRSIILSALLTVAVSAAHAQLTDPTPYCKGEYTNDYNMLASVTVNGTTHNIGTKGTFGDDGGYKFFNTFTFPVLNVGANNTVSVKAYGVFDGEPAYLAVYIDINRNNTFEANEVFIQNNNTINAMLNSGNNAADQTLTRTFMIPATASAGVTRMRVIRGQHTDGNKLYGPYDAAYTLAACRTLPPPAFPGDPGTDNSYGNCYDYNVTLKGGTTTAINEIEAPPSFRLYPNPAAGILNIDPADGKAVQSASVSDITGRIIINNRAVNKNQLDVSGLSKGVYLIRLQQKDGSYTDWVRFAKN